MSLDYVANDGETYQLNRIDTPGHVDFSHEVRRSLMACDGAIIIVDATQGVEAQSVANCITAIDQGLEVLPVLNKIDLPAAEPDRVMNEIEEIIGIDASESVRVSAKTGEGVPELLRDWRTHRARRPVHWPGRVRKRPADAHEHEGSARSRKRRALCARCHAGEATVAAQAPL